MSCLPEPDPRPPRKISCLVPFAALILAGLAFLLFHGKRQPPGGREPARAELPAPAPAPDIRLQFPVDREFPVPESEYPRLFQPSASGRPESALYGSTRTRLTSKKRVVSSFHEGIDIRAAERDARGRPLDPVLAAADGTVAYLNRHPGNSNYGIYAVLRHKDRLGDVFTLYAHLSELAPGLAAGGSVKAGAAIGRIGNTPSHIIRRANAHLHFEVAFMLNTRFVQWYRKRKLVPDHGNMHGWNLVGLDPLELLLRFAAEPEFTLAEHVRELVPAFHLVLRSRGQLDFFERHPALWSGEPYNGGVMFLAVSENGMPVGGRNAAPEEASRLGKARAAVSDVNTAALGRNGAHLVERGNGGWILSGSGKKWLDILEY